MKTRKFLLGALLASLGNLAATVQIHAEVTQRGFAPNGLPIFEAGIPSMVASMANRDPQFQSQWCWAACISAIFRHYGYRVSQARIVEEAWGALVDMPGSPQHILGSLNRPWTDDAGRSFRVTGDVLSTNPMTAAQDLGENHPLIIGTMGHAMVLTSEVYVRAPNGYGEVLEAIVRDPWPGRGRRVLSPQEWYNINFAVRIRVEED